MVVLVSFISTLQSLGGPWGSWVAAELQPAGGRHGSGESGLLAGVNLSLEN